MCMSIHNAIVEKCDICCQETKILAKLFWENSKISHLMQCTLTVSHKFLVNNWILDLKKQSYKCFQRYGQVNWCKIEPGLFLVNFEMNLHNLSVPLKPDISLACDKESLWIFFNTYGAVCWWRRVFGRSVFFPKLGVLELSSRNREIPEAEKLSKWAPKLKARLKVDKIGRQRREISVSFLANVFGRFSTFLRI